MSIYPAKNAKGDFTGSWTVEVMRQGKRTRVTAPDMKSARRVERLMQAGQAPPSDLRTPQSLKRESTIENRKAYKLRQLKIDSVRRYDGHKNKAQSQARMCEIVDILGPDKIVKEITYADLEKACDVLSRRGLGPKTVNRYLSAISGALKWAFLNGHIERQPPKPWRREGKGRSLVVPKTDDDAMYRWLEANASPHHLVYAVLVSTGIRVSELRNLKPADIEPEWLRLADTKSGDARDVPIESELSRPLLSLVARGRMPKYDHIKNAFVSASKAVGLPLRVTPHVLRHSAGTRMNSGGVPTATIQKFLGHKDVRTTLGYVHADNSALKEAAKHLSGPGKPW